MLTHQNLEDLLYQNGTSNITTKTEPSAVRNYFIDTSASWLFWTPIMTVVEMSSEMDNKQVLYSRTIGLALSTVLARPLGKFREYWSEYLITDSKSSWTRKYVTETTGVWCSQIPLYSLQLFISGASLEQGVKSLAKGLATTAVLGRAYGRFLDFWRKRWGGKPVLND